MLSFEIQPREAIPVEIRTDMGGFDSNATLSPARCLAGADCYRGQGGKWPALCCLAHDPTSAVVVGVTREPNRQGGLATWCASHLMKRVKTLKEGKQGPLAWRPGRQEPSEGRGLQP